MKNKKSVVAVVVTLLVAIFMSGCSSSNRDNDLYKRGYYPQVHNKTDTDYTNRDYMSRDHMNQMNRDHMNQMNRDHMSTRDQSTNERTNNDYDSTTNRNSDVTAQDQGNSDWDIKTTQMIRQQIVSQDGFSTNAKNVKVITIDGNVYLKGPVQTMAEKNRIESIARDVAGTTKVNSELKVSR